MWNVCRANVSKEINEIGSFENPVLGSSLGETVRESKAMVWKPNDDVPDVSFVLIIIKIHVIEFVAFCELKIDFKLTLNISVVYWKLKQIQSWNKFMLQIMSYVWSILKCVITSKYG